MAQPLYDLAEGMSLMKNVVLVTVDCLRYDRCGFNGHHRNTTPTLDSLATESLVFDNCYSTGPYTTESLPGILAGQHSYNGYQYGDHTAYKALPTDSPTLATAFSDAGYRTAAVISNPHLTENRNFDMGFDRFDNFRAATDADHDEGDSRFGDLTHEVRERMRSSPTRYNPLAFVYAVHRYRQLRSEWPTTDGADLTDRALNVLDDLTSDDSPFFLWNHYMDVHAPISPERAQSAGLGHIPTIRSLFWDASRAGRFYEPGYGMLYDSAVRYVDAQIGRLVDRLKSADVWDDTVLVVTSDHGEALFDRQGIYGHPPHYHYDELLHVPLLVTNAEQTGRVDGLISLAWLHELMAAVTEVQFTGFPSEGGSDDILSGGSDVAISDTLRGAGHTVTARDEHGKVIVHTTAPEGEPIEWEYGDEPICYRYDQDRGERAAMALVESELVDEARSRLTEMFELPEVGGEFDEATRQQLQDLGYRM
ncbi:MAG: sulfatase [Halapricum sp.]